MKIKIGILALIIFCLLPITLWAAPIIVQVQTTGGAGKPTWDAVQIYNPDSVPFDLNGHRLVKRTATGTEDTLKSFINSLIIIPPCGYFLWANREAQLNVVADATTSDSVANNNGVALRNGAEDTGAIISMLAWGEAQNVFNLAGDPLANLAEGQTLQRKQAGGVFQNSGATLDWQIGAAVPWQNISTSIACGNNNPPPANIPNTGGGTNLNSGQINKSEVVINELVSDPVTGATEWLELFNRTERSLDLSTLSLRDGSGAVHNLTGQLVPNGFLVVENLKFTLNNNGDLVELLKGEEVLDKVTYGDWDDGNLADNATAASDPASLARRQDGVDTDNDKNDFVVTQTVTKSASNQVSSEGGALPATISQSKVRLNEILPNPLAEDRGQEFVEIYNDGDGGVNLGQWQIKIAGQAQNLPTVYLASKNFLVLKYPELKWPLPNSGKNEIILADEKNNSVAKTSYSGETVAGFAWAYDGRAWQWTNQPTPSAENKLTPLLTDDELKAVIAAPKNLQTGELGLFDGSDTSGTLDPEELEYFWDFDDGQSATGLSAWHFFVKSGKYNVVLNVKRLSDGQGVEAKKVITVTGSSLVLEVKGQVKGATDGKKVATTKAKKITTKKIAYAPTKIAPLAQAKNWPLKAIVKTEGVVAVKSGLLAQGVFYLAGSGLRVVGPKEIALLPGERVRVTGEVREVQGERYLAVKTISAIEKLAVVEIPAPRELFLNEVSEENLGWLVKITGTIANVSGRYFYLENGEGSLRVYLTSGAFPQVPKLTAGNETTVSGLLSKTNNGLRLLPRGPEDMAVKVVEVAPTEKTQNFPWWGWAALALAIILGLFGDKLLLKLKSKN